MKSVQFVAFAERDGRERRENLAVGELDGRVAVVTGGTRGVGRAIAEAFVGRGARVVVNGRSETKGRDALEEIDGGAAVRFAAGDVMVRADCERVVDEATRHYGRLDILVNNAGGTVNPAPIAELSDEALSVTLRWNLWSTFWCTRRALSAMIPQRSGRIINVSSLAGKCAKPITGAYVAAKHAVNGLTKSCAAEAGPYGITVNGLCPGAMETDIFREVGVRIAAERDLTYEQFLDIFCTDAATGQPTKTADVAAVAVLLASDAGAGITGSLISIDGGTAPY
jgi:NAD(P)-dependent dehydrogenase (short-subunit alcohol dehydrogenase family)